MALLDLRTGPVNDLIDVLDGIGIADTGHAQIPLAHKAGTLQFDLDTAVNGDELGAGDAAGLFVILLIMALPHIQAAACHILIIGIGSLVHGVTGHGGDGAALEGCAGRDLHIILGDGTDDGLLGAVGFTAEGGALQNFAGIVSDILREALIDGCGSEHAGITGTTADDDISAHLQCLDEGMNTGHGHDTGGGIQFFQRQVGTAVETLNGLACQHLLPQVFFVHLGVEVGQLELLHVMFLCHVADHIHIHIHAAVGAGIAGRTDDHGHTLLPGCQQHQFQIVILPVGMAGALVRAQRHRTDIVAAGVTAVVIRLGSSTQPEALFLGGRKTQMPIGRDDAKRILCHNEPPRYILLLQVMISIPTLQGFVKKKGSRPLKRPRSR